MMKTGRMQRIVMMCLAMMCCMGVMAQSSQGKPLKGKESLKETQSQGLSAEAKVVKNKQSMNTKDVTKDYRSFEAHGKYGFKYNGKVIIPAKYDAAWNFREGLAAVEMKGKRGYIDKTGKTVIPLKYDVAREFYEGLAAVRKDGKWGYIDKKGSEVVPFNYDSAAFFSEGLAAVEQNGKYGFVDKNGNVVIPIKYDNAWIFCEGLAPVCQNGKYGYIDKSGDVVIAFQYDDAKTFSEGVAKVNSGSYHWIKIDKQGNEVK